jgi:hypothetical protein
VSELEWMAREERYRTRLTRTLVLMSLIAAAFFGTGFWVLNRQQEALEQAEAEAAETALLAQAAQARGAWVADSTAAAQRVSDFLASHPVEELEGAPVLVVKIPRGRGVVGYLGSVWDTYANAVEPGLSDERKRLLFKLRYVDVMNQTWFNSRGNLVWEGMNPPSAILLPGVRQKGKELDLEKPTFPQIVRGQETAGIRIIEEEELLDQEQLLEGAEDPEVTQNTADETPSEEPTEDNKP